MDPSNFKPLLPMSDTTPIFKSTDNHSPSTTAPGKSRSETTSPSSGGAAPGASLSSVLQSQKTVIAVLFAASLTLLFVIVLIWSGKLDRIVETWRSLFPTLLLFIIVSGVVLGFFLRSLKDDAAVESAGGPEADAAPVRKIPSNHSACECVQSQSGLIVVIHTDEGFIRIDAEALLESKALWSVDKPRMARWIDKPQDILA